MAPAPRRVRNGVVLRRPGGSSVGEQRRVADVAAAGGKVNLLVRQVMPPSGSNAGGAGHYSFGPAYEKTSSRFSGAACQATGFAVVGLGVSS